MDRRARPQGAQLAVVVIVALAAGAAGAWLTHAVDSSPQPGWTTALVVGCCLAGLVVWFASLGTRVVVDAAGILVYSLHGRPNLSFDLRAVSTLRMVQDGLVRGIGVGFAEPQAVRFLHKMGVSPERMRRWRLELDVDLVLEGFPAAMVGELAAVRDALPPLGAGASLAGA